MRMPAVNIRENEKSCHILYGRPDAGCVCPKVCRFGRSAVSVGELFFVACLFRALRSIRQAVALLPAAMRATCRAMFSMALRAILRAYARLARLCSRFAASIRRAFFRYFAQLRRSVGVFGDLSASVGDLSAICRRQSAGTRTIMKSPSDLTVTGICVDFPSSPATTKLSFAPLGRFRKMYGKSPKRMSEPSAIEVR